MGSDSVSENHSFLPRLLCRKNHYDTTILCKTNLTPPSFLSFFLSFFLLSFYSTVRYFKIDADKNKANDDPSTTGVTGASDSPYSNSSVEYLLSGSNNRVLENDEFGCSPEFQEQESTGSGNEEESSVTNQPTSPFLKVGRARIELAPIKAVLGKVKLVGSNTLKGLQWISSGAQRRKTRNSRDVPTVQQIWSDQKTSQTNEFNQNINNTAGASDIGLEYYGSQCGEASIERIEYGITKPKGSTDGNRGDKAATSPGYLRLPSIRRSSPLSLEMKKTGTLNGTVTL